MTNIVVLIEGPDNCGKSSLIRRLAPLLTSMDASVHECTNPSKEPGTPAFAIRQLMNSHQDELDNPMRTLLATCAIRMSYKAIVNNRDEDLFNYDKELSVHLMDRSEISTVCYQAMNTESQYHQENLMEIIDKGLVDVFDELRDSETEYLRIYCMHHFSVKENDTDFDPTREFGKETIHDNFRHYIEMNESTVGSNTPAYMVLNNPEDYDAIKLANWILGKW